MSNHDAWHLSEATEIVGSFAGQKGSTLPILHALQSRFGYVDKSIVPIIADALNLSRAEIHGTISFYHEFRGHAPGRHVLKLCRAEACQSRSAVALHAHVKKTLDVDWHGTTSDGTITLEPVFCLGLCANAPAAMVDEEPVGELDIASVDELIAEVRA